MKNATCSTQTISIEIERYQIENCIAQNCKRCTNILCFSAGLKRKFEKTECRWRRRWGTKERKNAIAFKACSQIDGKNQMKRKEERNITRSKHIQYVYIISEFIKWKWFQSTVEWLSFFKCFYSCLCRRRRRRRRRCLLCSCKLYSRWAIVIEAQLHLQFPCTKVKCLTAIYFPIEVPQDTRGKKRRLIFNLNRLAFGRWPLKRIQSGRQAHDPERTPQCFGQSSSSSNHDHKSR